MYGVMDSEGSVGTAQTLEWEGRKCANRQNTGVKEPSFPPLWIACCGECQTREMK